MMQNWLWNWVSVTSSPRNQEPHWKGVTTHGPITEVKQLWVWLILEWVTVWDTLVAAKMWFTPAAFCYGLCHMSMQEVPRVLPNSWKARVCDVMPMWLVHIKEHVWTIRTCPTTILLSAMNECVNEYCIKRQNKKEALPHMRWQTCMLPRELIWEGWLSLKKSGMMQYEKKRP